MIRLKPLPAHTLKNGVITTHGFIPHLMVNGIELAVKLKPTSDATALGDPRTPIRIAGLLVYATPGGGEHLGPSTYDLSTINSPPKRIAE